MSAIVTPTGVYHGHTDSVESAHDIRLKKKMDETFRILTDAEWERVANAPQQRAELCAMLGVELA